MSYVICEHLFFRRRRMSNDRSIMPGDIPDFVKEAEAAIAAGEDFIPAEQREITIKFGKGLVGEPFVSKNGNELVEIKIPNTDPKDSRPWESFVISPKIVHENKFGKGMWMKLPEDGITRLARNVSAGIGTDGKKIWKTEYRNVQNTELKSLLEAYKTRESVLGKLSKKKEAIDSAPKPVKPKTKTNDVSL